MSAIHIEALRKRYGAIQALDGLDLDVETGTVFGFLGPNGAGKTTTLRILAGLAHPTSGRAWVAGQPVGPDSPARSLIGYLPEEPRFYGWMTPREFLGTYVGGLFSLPAAEARARAEAVIEQVGLTDASRRRIAGFSRGMRQRLGLAQALMNRPQVLLLDEPVSALDPAGRHDMLELIGRLRAEATVFMSTHILEDVERICDTVGVINRGRLVAVEDRERLLERFAVPAVEADFQADSEQVARWAAEASRHPGVAGVDIDGTHARLRLRSRAQAGEVQRLAMNSGMLVARYQIARPTLEEVFLHLVEA